MASKKVFESLAQYNSFIMYILPINNWNNSIFIVLSKYTVRIESFLKFSQVTPVL